MHPQSNKLIEIPKTAVPQKTIFTNGCIIAGAPSSGKTSVLNELRQRNYEVLPEPAEELLKAAIEAGKTAAEVRRDPIHWQHQVAQADFALMQQMDIHKLIFADTSMMETYAFAQRAGMDFGPNLKTFLKRFRFKAVFFLEPLELHETTEVRLEDQQTARELSGEILAIYELFGYDPFRVPPVALEERLKIILEKLKAF